MITTWRTTCGCLPRGVPWFVTLFGRDSLIAALQNMIINPAFARGCLKKLAEFQAAEFDDWRDAEPGKVLHELRSGELAHFHRIPHTPYYGSADSTPLYLIVLHEAWKWTGDESLLREYREAALRCLNWIDRYGDLDGDGFQEYRSRSKQGIKNQGWKDSGDAVVYPDGSQVEPPIATCELQGYAFDARLRMAEAFEALGERERAAELRQKAADLQKRFEEQFWCEELAYYVYALDSKKKARSKRGLESRPSTLERNPAAGPRRTGGQASDGAGHVERVGHSDPLCRSCFVQSIFVSARRRLAA